MRPRSKIRKSTRGPGRSAFLYIGAWRRTFNSWNSSVCRLPKSCCTHLSGNRQEQANESSILDFVRTCGRRGGCCVDGHCRSVPECPGQSAKDCRCRQGKDIYAAQDTLG